MKPCQYGRNGQFVFGVIGALLVSWSSHVDADGLIGGHYLFRTRYPAVCLAGTYPITLGGMDTGCTIDIHTDALGNLTGTAAIRSLSGTVQETWGLARTSRTRSSSTFTCPQTMSPTCLPISLLFSTQLNSSERPIIMRHTAISRWMSQPPSP